MRNNQIFISNHFDISKRYFICFVTRSTIYSSNFILIRALHLLLKYFFSQNFSRRSCKLLTLFLMKYSLEAYLNK